MSKSNNISIVPTEAQEQRRLVMWLQYKKLFFFAPTNENNTYKQNRKYALIAEQKAKSLGKLKGVSDLVIFLPNKILFLELKRAPKRLKNGKLSFSHTKVSKEQEAFKNKVNQYPYAKAVIAYGADDAIRIVEEELKVRSISNIEKKLRENKITSLSFEKDVILVDDVIKILKGAVND